MVHKTQVSEAQQRTRTHSVEIRGWVQISTFGIKKMATSNEIIRFNQIQTYGDIVPICLAFIPAKLRGIEKL